MKSQTNNRKAELLACVESPAYFVDNYCQVYDASAKGWVPFTLWRAQHHTLSVIERERLVIVLKARQLGLTWLVLGYSLWLMLCRPAATVLLFSQRDDEAVHLLDFRLKGMYERLPDWMKTGTEPGKSSGHEWRLSNGSAAMAFPTTGGRSYTATLAIVDEADFAPSLNTLMNAVKPTIDAGGRMILVSTADKSQPESEFKRIYRAAKMGDNPWASVFLPWHTHPGRNAVWYEDIRRDVLARTGSLDDLYQEYPATDTEALAPKELDKRISPAWLRQCYAEQWQIPEPTGAPSIPALEVYRLPERGKQYVIGIDPAEGNPTSDDSALAVLDRDSGEEVAALAGKYQPEQIAAHADAIGRWYMSAGVLVERNNHGHAVLLWLRNFSRLARLKGFDDKEGWLSSSRGKTMLYDDTAEAFREQETVLHSFKTFVQLQSIEGSTLRAPEGTHDDRADAYALALVAMKRNRSTSFSDLSGAVERTASRWQLR